MAGRRPSAPPPREEVRDEDWYARPLSAEGYAGIAFIDVDMTEVVDVGSVFEDCTFRGVRFNVSTHTNAAFLRCTFSGCSFFDATFTGCKLLGSRFENCTWSQLTIAGGDWSDETQGKVKDLVSRFADDFGHDLDEDGQPITDGGAAEMDAAIAAAKTEEEAVPA